MKTIRQQRWPNADQQALALHLEQTGHCADCGEKIDFDDDGKPFKCACERSDFELDLDRSDDE